MSYVAGTILAFSIPLIDDSGQSIGATAVSYSIADSVGVILFPDTAIAGYSEGTKAVFTVSALINTLGAGLSQDARQITLTCTTASGIVKATVTYALTALSGLIVRGVNSAVTLAAADMKCSQMTEIGAWATANNQSKTNALIEAYRRLGKLRFIPLDNFYYNQSQNPFRRQTATSLLDLSVTEVLGLNAKLLDAIANAQVAEADVILTGTDSIELRRREGLVLDAIGDVKQMYRNSKPLDLPISRRALQYVVMYTSIGTKSVGRG